MTGNNFNVESIGHDIRSTQFSRMGCCDTLTANDFKDPTIVCYAIENHPCDSRVTLTEDGIVQTLNARMGTGDGNVPMVIMGIDCCNTENIKHVPVTTYVVDSHPADSRMEIVGDTVPTITAHIVKGSADGPLILTRRDDR